MVVGSGWTSRIGQGEGIVTDEAQLEQQLQDRNAPRRLVMDFAFLEPDCPMSGRWHLVFD